MEYAISILFGYLLGSLSPAALISKLKKTNLRNTGTGNLGATNTALTFGKKFGILVMAFDVAKGAGSVLLVHLLFKQTALLAGILAGFAAVLGHMYPFYMKFKGGKGLAAFGGAVLAFDPLIFLLLLAFGFLCMLLTNRGIALTVSASLLFPVLVGIKYRADAHAILLTLIAALISLVVILRHRDNITRAIRSQEMTMSQFFAHVFKKK